MAVPLLLALASTVAYGDNLAKDIKKAAERSTLDQPGTRPFRLRAQLAPSFERDKNSGRSGEIEIWWASPTQWKRELRSPEFHLTEINNGEHTWQKTEGTYFPQWLEQTAAELILPVPPLTRILDQIPQAEVRRIGPMTSLSWATPSGTSEAHGVIRATIALQNSTGLLLYASGLGWGAEFKDYADFHGRMVAHTVNIGSPQVTAKITTLEELGELPSDFFDANRGGSNPYRLRTVLIDEASLRKNLEPFGPLSWPPVQDGPLQGTVTTQIVVDVDGKVREVGPIAAENPALSEYAKETLTSMRFKPFVFDGALTQVLSQIVLPFKTERPAGSEKFDSAESYFEQGRHLGFPAYGRGTPYVLHAEFEAQSQGSVVKGQYIDTWLSDTQWFREVRFANSRYVRSRNGEKRYQLAEGEHAGLLRLIMRIMEPLPAIDTFTESDWRIKRDTVGTVPAIRVLAGYENPDGKLDPEQARGYWFDATGSLIKTYFLAIETDRSDFQDFDSAKVARQIDVIKDGHLGMLIHVTEIKPTSSLPSAPSAESFELKGHEWTRAFTSEVR
jgi:hypothetical protein